ncbi:MAG: hypothetical protein ACOY3X_09660 [Pseudomonadota bacterium]
MIGKIETLKDSLQVAVDSGTERLERIHNMIADYATQHVREIKGEDVIDRQSIYTLIRGINRELGEAATDLFEMVESARLAAAARKDKEKTP